MVAPADGAHARRRGVLVGGHVRRGPNPHLAFGHGVHFCLGANLARLEMRVVFEELLPAFARFDLAGPAEWTRSNRHTGIRHLPLRAWRGGSA